MKIRDMAIIERLERAIRKGRRALAKRIEPQDPEPAPEWDVPIGISLQGAEAIREVLRVDEGSYLRVAGATWADPRSYVLSTALDEVTKTAMHLMRIREFLSGGTISPHDDRMSRLLVTHVLEELHARARRLLEVLVALILFHTTNQQGHYRHLLLLEDLNSLLSSNSDLEEFYGARSVNIDDSIEHELERIEEVEGKIDLSTCWYRSNKSPIRSQANLRPGGILSSVRSRIREAVPFMTDSERLLFGYSYSGMYGQTSETVHYSVSRKDFRLQAGDEHPATVGLGLLNFAILERCHQLLDSPEIAVVDRLRQQLSKSNASRLVHTATVRDIEVGDFVLAYGDLAEIVEIRVSDYAYRSYRVRYLAEKPKPNIQEDWFPARYVRLFYNKQRFKEVMSEMVSAGHLPPDIVDRFAQLEPQEVQTIIGKSLSAVWKSGLREWVRKQRPSQDTDRSDG